MVFLKADKKNAHVLKRILEDFYTLSGLKVNLLKSVVYFGGPVAHRDWISSHLGLQIGELPVKYLGLPLLSKRLSMVDYEPLL